MVTTSFVSSSLRSTRVLGTWLLSSVLLAVACGEGTREPKTPASVIAPPDGTSSAPSLPPSAASASPSLTAPVASGTAGARAQVGEAPAHHGPMNSPVASQMVADLQAIGLDPRALPPLDKLSGDKLRKVMRTFTKALGAKCSDCHAEDFAAPTDSKAIAARMWNDFSRAYTLEGGGALYCDSCHQGHMEFLDTRDKKALSKWMDDNFVAKLKRTDGKEQGCDNCHGDPFEGDIFKGLWLPQAKAKLGASKAGLPAAVTPRKP